MLLHITPSERVVLELLASGGYTPDIAARLRISEGEVEGYLTSLYARLGAATQAEAVTAAIRRGLVNVPAARDARVHEAAERRSVHSSPTVSFMSST